MRIEIEDLTFSCIIGLLDFERVKEQKVVIDINIDYTYTKDNFINYVNVVGITKNTLKINKFKLLEDALNSTKEAIVKEFHNIKKLSIKISKPDILDDCIVSLSDNWNIST